MCVAGTPSAAIELKSSISGATTYADREPATIGIDVTVNQAAVVLLSALATVQCAWFDATDGLIGPVGGDSTLASLSLVGTTNHVDIGVKAQVGLIAGESANLRCRFIGVSLTLGGFEVSGWALEATRTA